MDQYYSNYTVKTLNYDFTHSNLPLNIFFERYIYIHTITSNMYIYIYVPILKIETVNPLWRDVTIG